MTMMSARRLILCLLSAAIAVTMLWGAFAADAPATPASMQRRDDAASVSATLDTTPTATPTDTGIAARKEVPTTGHDGRRVRIVDENGKPVGNASVHFDTSEDLDAKTPVTFDIEARLASTQAVTSTADGIALLPTNSARAFVVARAGEHFGTAYLEFDSLLFETPTLTIRRDRTLHLVVVSSSGLPYANVPVELAYEGSIGGNHWQTRELPRSSARGEITVWHAQNFDFCDPAHAAVTLRALVSGAKTTPVQVRLDRLPSDTIAIECPPHGGIEVHAWIRPGVANRMPIEGILWSPTQKEIELVQPGATPAKWTLHPLALRTAWTVDTVGFESAEVPELMRDGDTASVDILMDPEWMGVTAIVLQPDGQPGRSLDVEIRMLVQIGGRHRTDPEGRVTFLAPRAEGDAEFRGDASQTATVSWSKPGETESLLDLGRVQLSFAPLVVSGQVVDATTKQPIRAHLELTGEAGGWLRGAAKMRGDFELRSSSLKGPFALSASSPGYLSTTRTGLTKGQSLVIELNRARLLRATVLADPPMLPGLSGTLFFHSENTPAFAQEQAGASLHCVCELPNQNKATFDVLDASGFVLLRIEPDQWVPTNYGFQVTGDLRGKLTGATLTCAHQDGRPPEGRLWLRIREDTPWLEHPLQPQRNLAFPVGSKVEAIAAPWSGPAQHVALVAGENHLVLEPALQARFVVPKLPGELAPTPISIRMACLTTREPLLDRLASDGVRLDDRNAQPWPTTAQALDALLGWSQASRLDDGSASFTVPHRGSYIAVPYVGTRESDEGAITWHCLLDAAMPIEVTTPGVTVEATLQLDADRVRRVLRKTHPR
ncbi:MAG: carboxypeptidase regulatory-like domain-containing protein [Planctomycetes bacterium]|nr:carboxypeptidase regulatory-like domain-containing protein [Planctomycetota bacterium]